MKRHDLLSVAVLALGLLFPAAAFAEGDGDDPKDGDQAKADKSDNKVKRPSRRQARKKFAEGTRHTNEGNYEQAIEAFREAYEHDPLPDTLYNLGTVCLFNLDPRQAYEYYEKYLAAAPKGPLAPSARRFMTRLKDQIAAEDARLAREQALEAQAARAEKLEKDAAEAGRAHAETVQRLEAELDQARKQAATAKPKRGGGGSGGTGGGGGGSGKRIIGTSLMALGGLALGLGLEAGLDARSAHSELDALGMDDAWSQGYEWVHDRGERAQGRMILFSITGAVLVGGGATLYYLGSRDAGRAPKEKKLSAVPALGPTSAGIQVSGQF